MLIKRFYQSADLSGMWSLCGDFYMHDFNTSSTTVSMKVLGMEQGLQELLTTGLVLMDASPCTQLFQGVPIQRLVTTILLATR